MLNLIEPGDEVIVGVIGYVGQRLQEMAERAGANVRVLEAPFGQIVTPERFERELATRPRFTPAAHRLPMLNVIRIPDGVDDAPVRGRPQERGIEISGGFGLLKGKTPRCRTRSESEE